MNALKETRFSNGQAVRSLIFMSVMASSFSIVATVAALILVAIFIFALWVILKDKLK